MVRSKRFSFVAVIAVAILLFAGNRSIPVQATSTGIATPTSTNIPATATSSQGEVASTEQQEEIKSVIQSYFGIRYNALNASQPNSFQLTGFGDLVSDQPDAKAFLNAELGKLAVDIKHARLNHLRYVDYKYVLDFKNIVVDAVSQTATVSVTEGNEIIYEISKEHDPQNPIVSRMSGLEHQIALRQEQGKWKITADYYNDYLWRVLRETGKSSDEMLRTMKALPEPSLHSARAQAQVQCTNLPAGPTHAYDRTGAVNYANEHSYNYNPDYPNYDDGSHGDCTNFVSQAIYEGGNASMAIPDPLPSPSPNGQVGWYLLNDTQRASAWNDVSALYDFVTHPYSWDEGPEGCDVTINDLMPGDVIQYGDGSTWYHSVIVVEIKDGIPYVASHSPNISPIAYNRFDYFGNYSDIRFIRIEQSKGNPPVKARIEQGSDDAGTNPTPCTFSATDNEVYLGACFGGSDITSGFRFNNIQIPRTASIKYAYLTFTVDGTYTVPINVQIYGEANGNSGTFTVSNPPVNRPITNGVAFWNIVDEWILGKRRTAPQLSSVIQEIVDRQDWNSGNSLSLIVKNAGSTNVRRVIAFERASWDPNLSPAKLIVAYSLEGLPTPTVTPTATPTSTPTPIPSPTPVPTETPVPTSTPGIEPTSPPPWWAPAENVLMRDEPAQEREAFSKLLSQIRNQILESSPKGDAYIEMIYQHAPEIMTILSRDENLRQQVKDLALEIQPLLESVVSNEAEFKKPRLEKTWIEKAIVVLDDVKKQASPNLQAEIDWWKKYLPGFAGKTGKEIWEMLPER